MAIVERHTTFQKTQETFSMDLYLRVLVVLFIDFSHVMTLRMVALNKIQFIEGVKFIQNTGGSRNVTFCCDLLSHRIVMRTDVQVHVHFCCCYLTSDFL